MSVHIEGFDEFKDELEQLSERAKGIDGGNEVPMDELFRPDFMRTHTKFDSLDEFFEESPWTVESRDDFKQIPEDEFDEYVNEHTGFNSWDAMLSSAGREWVARQLGIN